MLDYNPITHEKGSCIAVGRGAIAIYLAIRQLEEKNGHVLVPANICYAAVFPIIYAGCLPIFCDVDQESGNITLEEIEKNYSDNVIAAIVPHMYGNPIIDLPLIANFCHERGIILIEDCASMMGGESDNFRPGTVGDYVVYSTGYSKTIDIGFGGMLFSKQYDLTGLELLEQSFPIINKEISKEWNVFSKLYRVIRNEGEDGIIAKEFYKILPDACKDLLLFSINEKKKGSIFQSINSLKEVIKNRRFNFNLYNQLITYPKEYHYSFNQGAVPWRYNLFIKKEKRKDFIDFCLKNALPVSDWYPTITKMFGINQGFPGAKWHEEHIVNFPIMIREEEIRHICEILNQYQFE